MATHVRHTTTIDAEDATTARVLLGGILGGIAAVVGNLLLFVLVRSLGVDMVAQWDATQPPTVLKGPEIPVACLVPAILGAVTFLLMRRFMKEPVRAFEALALAVLVFSFGSPWTLPEANVATKLALSAMHLVAAAAILRGILWPPRGFVH